MAYVHTAYPPATSTPRRARIPTVHARIRERRLRGGWTLGMVTFVARSAGTTSVEGIWATSCRRGLASGRPTAARESCSVMARALGGRSARSLAVAARTVPSRAGEATGATAEGGATDPLRCWYAMASDVSPAHGARPVRSANLTTPTA